MVAPDILENFFFGPVNTIKYLDLSGNKF